MEHPLFKKYLEQMRLGTRAWEVSQMESLSAPALNKAIDIEKIFFEGEFRRAAGIKHEGEEEYPPQYLKNKLADLYVEAKIVPGRKEAELIIEKKVQRRSDNFLNKAFPGRSR